MGLSVGRLPLAVSGGPHESECAEDPQPMITCLNPLLSIRCPNIYLKFRNRARIFKEHNSIIQNGNFVHYYQKEHIQIVIIVLKRTLDHMNHRVLISQVKIKQINKRYSLLRNIPVYPLEQPLPVLYQCETTWQ